MQDQLPYLVAGCALALLSALAVVGMKRPVHCAVALLVHSLTLAGLYMVLNAQFVAVGQVIIYSGAIVVLFLFVVLLLPQGGRGERGARARDLAAVVAGIGMFVVLAGTMVGDQPAACPAGEASVALVGHSLFGPMLVPFELTALPMLLAIVAAVTLWRRQEKQEL